MVWKALSLAWELGYVIALPLILWLLLGRWIDRRLDSAPWATLCAIILALLTTGYWLWKKLDELKTKL